MSDATKEFRFYINKHEEKPHFRCRLAKHRCPFHMKGEKQCSRMVVEGVKYCGQHSVIAQHLRIAKSKYSRALGVYADCPKKVFKTLPTNQEGYAIIFHQGHLICKYEGEHINEKELEHRYGNKTPPFCIKVADDNYIDGACSRSISSMIHHSNEADANCIYTRLKAKDGSQSVYIKAKRDILHGEELLVHYGSHIHVNDDSKEVNAYKMHDNTHFSTRPPPDFIEHEPQSFEACSTAAQQVRLSEVPIVERTLVC
jgi:hypothetical protein